ncbi:MAG: tyrosine-type recombinase/integrase [Anaerolineales bacterium]|nr:tyrosine-type recombinase/integrase [Anaerolineales bacterium]
MSQLTPASQKENNNASDVSMTVAELQDHPVAVYLAGLSPSSRRTMTAALDIIAQLGLGNPEATCWDVPWHQLRFQHTQVMRSALMQQYAHTTANRMLSALRGVLKAAWKLGLMSAEDYQKAASIESIRGETLPSGRSLAAGELVGLLHVCPPTPLGIRDAAIISLLYGCGLRRAELVALDLAHHIKEENELYVRGKGNKQRAVPLGNAALALADWLAVRGNSEGPLFWGLGNRNHGRRLTDQAIYNMLRKRAKEAGIKNLSPHDFRRTFVGDLLDAGADIVTVQKMAGHASPTTTSRYDRRGQKTRHKAASLLTIPYRKRDISAES